MNLKLQLHRMPMVTDISICPHLLCQEILSSTEKIEQAHLPSIACCYKLASSLVMTMFEDNLMLTLMTVALRN